MSVIQISKIQMRRGYEIDIPGTPSSLSPLTFNTGLDVGEMGYSIDTGRLFIGQAPTIGQPNYNRTQFPYQNIEVLTENAGNTLRRIHEGFHRFVGSNGFFQSVLTKQTTTWTDVVIPQTTGDNTAFRINGSFLTSSIEYFAMDASQNPLRQGTLRILSQIGATETLLIDDCISAPRADLDADDAIDPSIVSGNLQFRMVRVGTNVDPHFRLQYKNDLNVNCVLFFSVLRPVTLGIAQPILGSVNSSGSSSGSGSVTPGSDQTLGSVTVQKLTVQGSTASQIKVPGTLYISATGVVVSNGNVVPSQANAQDIGSALLPFGNIYASNLIGNTDTATKLQSARAVVFNGDATASLSFDGSASLVVPITLKTTGVSAGTYSKVTVDTKGRVTAGASVNVADIGNLHSTVAGTPASSDDLRAMLFASAMPLTGTYSAGDMVFSTSTTVLGAVTAQYTILGWRRVTTGSAHIINADWVEMRVFTGT